MSDSPLFVPKSQWPRKFDKKREKKGSSQQICLRLLPNLTGQRASKNTARATQNLYVGHGLDAPGLIRPKLMLQTKNARNFRTSGGSLNFNWWITKWPAGQWFAIPGLRECLTLTFFYASDSFDIATSAVVFIPFFYESKNFLCGVKSH